MGLQPYYRPCVGWPVPGALLVRPQPCQLGVRALADETLVWALARVEAHVVTEGGGLAEAAVAETADEGLVQSVYAHVGAQVTAGVEAAVADDAAHAAGGGKRGGGGGVTQVEIITFFNLLLFVLYARDSWDTQESVVGISIPHK